MQISTIDNPSFWDAWPFGLMHLKDDYKKMKGDLALYLLGPPDSNPAAIVALRMAPNFTLARHSHTCHRLEIMMQGSLDIGDNRVVGPGDVMTSVPDVSYGPHIAGREGSISLEIFGDYRASYTQVLQTPDGVFRFDSSSIEGYRQYRATQQKYAMSGTAARSMADAPRARSGSDQHFLSPADQRFWQSRPPSMRMIEQAHTAGSGRLAFFLMGEIDRNPPLIAAHKLGPGERLEGESLACDRFKTIVSGSARFESGQALEAGGIIVARPQERCEPIVAGPGGALLFEIFGDGQTAQQRFASAASAARAN